MFNSNNKHHQRVYFIWAEMCLGGWARGVQWYLTRIVDPSYTVYYFGNYTGVVEDLVDRLGGPGHYDQVSGYTMYQIEQALKGAKTWTEWKNNIKNKYDNATENQLDNLFAYWSN